MLKRIEDRVELDFESIQKTLRNHEKSVNYFRKYDLTFFYHQIRGPDSNYELRYEERIPEEQRELSIQKRFYQILEEGHLEGRAKGMKITQLKDPLKAELLKSVSFSLYSFEELLKSRKKQKEQIEEKGKGKISNYYIVFDHTLLLNNGIKPVKYFKCFNDKSTKEQKLDDITLLEYPYLFDVAPSKEYDYSWENEWRIKHHLDFELDNIAFVIVPTKKYEKILSERGSKLGEEKIFPSLILEDPSKFNLNKKYKKCNFSREIEEDLVSNKVLREQYKKQFLGLTKLNLAKTYQLLFFQKIRRINSYIDKGRNFDEHDSFFFAFFNLIKFMKPVPQERIYREFFLKYIKRLCENYFQNNS